MIAAQWYVAWKWEERDGHKTKVPYVSATQRANVWSKGPFLSPAEAQTLAKSEGFAGMGIVFGAHPLVGVDLDGCRDPQSGDLEPWAQQIVDGLDSHTTPTPSGTGVRVWIKAPKDVKGPRKRQWRDPTWTAPKGVTKAPGIEVFLTGGFCTIPDDGLDEDRVQSRPTELATLLASAPAPKNRVGTELPPLRNADLSMDEVVALFQRTRPKAYHKLFVAGAGPKDDDSGLDHWLSSEAAELLGGDPVRIEQFMGRSAIARNKGGTGDNKWLNQKGYLDGTIATVIAALTPEAVGPTEAAVVRSMEDFLKNPDALRPPPAVIARLAYAGRIVMTAGVAGYGKSTIYKAGCAAVTTGQAFLGHVGGPPGDVLWARLEESEYDLFANLKRFQPDASRFYAFRPGSAPLDELVAMIRSRFWMVTVIDSIHQLLADCGVKNFDDSAQVSAVFAPLERACRDTGTAMVWIGKANRQGEYRNSSEFLHTPDLVWEIEKPSPGSTVRKFRIAKTRLDAYPFRVELVKDRYELAISAHDDAPKTTPPSPTEAKVLKALRDGMEWAEWKAACKGITADTFKSSVKRLKEKELVTLDDETGKYTVNQFELLQTKHEKAA